MQGGVRAVGLLPALSIIVGAVCAPVVGPAASLLLWVLPLLLIASAIAWRRRASRAMVFCLLLGFWAGSAVLTSSRAAELTKGGQPAPTILPCAVETEVFRANPDERERLRRTLSLEGTVFVYAGKIGGWYLVEPMIERGVRGERGKAAGAGHARCASGREAGGALRASSSLHRAMTKSTSFA